MPAIKEWIKGAYFFLYDIAETKYWNIRYRIIKRFRKTRQPPTIITLSVGEGQQFLTYRDALISIKDRDLVGNNECVVIQFYRKPDPANPLAVAQPHCKVTLVSGMANSYVGCIE